MAFNNGKPYHGSMAVHGGALTGATGETDYFYFFCPKCPDKYIVRILDWGIHGQEKENKYNPEFEEKARSGFTLVFKLHCENCGHTDFVKVSNLGWQGGNHATIVPEARRE